MAIADETTLRVVLYEGEGAATLDAAERVSTLTTLLEKGYAVTCAGKGAVAPADDSALFDIGRGQSGGQAHEEGFGAADLGPRYGLQDPHARIRRQGRGGTKRRQSSRRALRCEIKG